MEEDCTECAVDGSVIEGDLLCSEEVGDLPGRCDEEVSRRKWSSQSASDYVLTVKREVRNGDVRGILSRAFSEGKRKRKPAHVKFAKYVLVHTAERKSFVERAKPPRLELPPEVPKVVNIESNSSVKVKQGSKCRYCSIL